MHMASTVPQQHLTACHTVDIVAKIVVRTEDDFSILRQLVNHALGIATGHYYIGQSLHSSCSVDIAHHQMIGMLLLELPQIVSLAAVSQ